MRDSSKPKPKSQAKNLRPDRDTPFERETDPSSAQDPLLTPVSLVQTASKVVPSFKWIIGAAAAFGLAASVISWGFNVATLSLIVGVLLVVAMALIALHWISVLDPKKTSMMAAFVAWSLLLVLVGSVVLIFTSVANDRPWPFRKWIIQQIEKTPTAAAETSQPTPESLQEIALRVLEKMESIKFIHSASSERHHMKAAALLGAVISLDSSLQGWDSLQDVPGEQAEMRALADSTWRTSGWFMLDGKHMYLTQAEARAKRDELLVSYRAEAALVLDDWRTVVEVISQTNSSAESISEINAALGSDLKDQLPTLSGLQDALQQGIDIATGGRYKEPKFPWQMLLIGDPKTLLERGKPSMVRLHESWNAIAVSQHTDK